MLADLAAAQQGSWNARLLPSLTLLKEQLNAASARSAITVGASSLLLPICLVRTHKPQHLHKLTVSTLGCHCSLYAVCQQATGPSTVLLAVAGDVDESDVGLLAQAPGPNQQYVAADAARSAHYFSCAQKQVRRWRGLTKVYVLTHMLTGWHAAQWVMQCCQHFFTCHAYVKAGKLSLLLMQAAGLYTGVLGNGPGGLQPNDLPGDWRSLNRKFAHKAFLCTPIRQGGKLLGALVLSAAGEH